MIHVLYHNHCADGFLARVIAQRKLGFAVKYHAVNYKEPVPMVFNHDLDADVYILDFSYPRETLEWIRSKVRKLVVLDHHKTALENLKGLDYCTFDMKKSGAMLAWEHFFPKQLPPMIVRYVQDRDLGNPWSDPENAMGASLNVHAGLFRAQPRTYDAWSRWLDAENLDPLIDAGAVITRMDQRIIRTVAEHPLWIRVGDHEVPAAQLSPEYISDACNAMLLAHPDAPFAACWFVNGTGQVVYSLRSRRGGFDVSALAKSLGGGGHAQAAGFSIEEAPQFA